MVTVMVTVTVMVMVMVMVIVTVMVTGNGNGSDNGNDGLVMVTVPVMVEIAMTPGDNDNDDGNGHAGVCSLRGSTRNMAKIARWTLLYYAGTTVTAVVLGLALVTVLNPGRGSPLGGDGVSSCGVDQVGCSLSRVRSSGWVTTCLSQRGRYHLMPAQSRFCNRKKHYALFFL